MNDFFLEHSLDISFDVLSRNFSYIRTNESEVEDYLAFVIFRISRFTKNWLHGAAFFIGKFFFQYFLNEYELNSDTYTSTLVNTGKRADIAGVIKKSSQEILQFKDYEIRYNRILDLIKSTL